MKAKYLLAAIATLLLISGAASAQDNQVNWNSLTEAQQSLRTAQEPMTISKVNKRSTVHRRVPLDAITIKKYDRSI